MESTPRDLEALLSEARQRIQELELANSSSQSDLAKALREAENNAILAQAAQDEMSHFVYAASHDLQQPLRAIGTYAQLLQREYAADERAREFTAFIVEGAAQMNALLRDLLTYSHTGNTAQRSPVKLNAPFQWALYTLAQAVKDSRAQVTVEDLPEAYADEKQIVKVFEHLIGNAIKFRGADPPRVEVSSETGEEYHTVSIRDNGLGIEPQYQDQIFEPFKRLHSKEIPGSGLCLAICRKILRAHGGKLWVESSGQNGSVFKFTLPI